MSDSRHALPSPAEIAKLPPDGGPDFNRLIHSQSPYLLQHARNPVDWWPWGDAAFAAAAEQDKPVFLSVGYSTCHWCHVMEHESFEDETVAALLNAAFICVKVDREERPDIDSVYMTVTQAITGQGGWPMTVLLTADRRPFFAGTYFPKEGRYGRPGMLQLVPAVQQAWQADRAKVLASATQITERLQGYSAADPGPPLLHGTLALAHEQLAQRYDAVHGGFGQAPKFPTPHNLNFLLRVWARGGDEAARDMAAYTALQMRRGGVYDHVGFGTHRYSTDRQWLVPHFEKMLYDQALVMLANSELYQATGDARHAEIVREIAAYVARDMTDPAGGFYSAEDADSEGEEGLFYLWTRAQVLAALGAADGTLYADVMQITAAGNYREEATGRETGQSIPHRTADWPELAASHGEADVAAFRARLDGCRQRLFALREERVHPYKDDKVLTDWNGLMIAALAHAGRVLDEPAYTAAARRAGEFVWSALRDGDGRLLKRWRQGQAGLPAHLADYSYMAWGCLELHQSTGEPAWLARAVDLTEHTLAHFRDADSGAFYLTADYGEALIVRHLEIYDGAQPSANSVAALNLLRLHALTGRTHYAEHAEAIFRAFSGQVSSLPSGHCHLMLALDFALGPSHELVLVGHPDAADTRAMLAALRPHFLPRLVVLRKTPGDAALDALAPYSAAMSAIDGKATAYVCSGFSCQAPTTDPAQMLRHLGLDAG